MNIRIGHFAAWAAVAGATLMLGAPASGVASASAETARGHLREDAVSLSPRSEAQLSRETMKKTAAAAAAAAAATRGPGEVGQWGPVVEWPVVAINAALLPNGKVLAYDSIGDHATESYPEQNHTRATVWDPASGSQSNVTLSDGHNIFCSGLAHMTDGNLFIAGGNKNQALEGIVQTHYFDSNKNAWSSGTNMAYARWYPSVTPMGSGEMLITSGGPAIPEVRATDGTLRQLSNASLGIPLYPWFDVAPDGRAFDSGPDQTMRSLDPSGAGAWQLWSSRDSIDRTYGSHAMYDVGKILVAGGGPSTNTAEVIDINGATPTATPTGAMAYGRRQNNLTVLADGTALVTGGNSSGAKLVDLNAGVYPAELWNPASGRWTTLASMRVTRQYHSTALLLPDGRVLSAGGGICGECDTVGYLNKNAEIFSPPYLFAKDGSGALAPRPTVAAAPTSVTEGTKFTVSTPDAASISKVALVRLGAVTHSNNMEQRYVPAQFTAGSGTLTVTAPANVNIAPPGYYMLFLVNSAGVPSVAPILSVAPPTGPPPPPTTFGKTTVGGSSDTFAADRKRVNEYSLPVGGAVSKLSIYLAPGGTSGQQVLEGILYANAAGAPGSLLGTTAPLTFSSTNAAGWYDLSFPTPLKLAAGSYWIGVITGATGKVAGFRYDGVASSRDVNTNTYSSGPSNPFGSVSRDSEQMSLYATYTTQTSVPINTTPPAINGTAQRGWTLTEVPGTWTNGPTSFTYQWQRCDAFGNACAPISKATSQSYVAAPGDVGHTLRVQETAANASGPGGPATSAQTAVVQAEPPANTAPPTISGTAAVGQTLSASTGSWTENPTRYEYQWQRCDSGGAKCAPITPATASTYAVTSPDTGSTLRVTVTASNSAGSSTPASSAQTAVVQQPPPTFGKTTVGASSDAFAANRKRVNEYSLPVAGAVSKLSIYLAPGGTSGQQVLEGILYQDAAGKPGNLLGTTAALTFASTNAAGWYGLSFATPLKLAAGNYWIGVITGETAKVAGFRYDGVAGSRDVNTNTYSSGPSNPFGSVTTDSEQTSLYATYTPGG